VSGAALVRELAIRYIARAALSILIVGTVVLMVGCGTTGSTFIKDRPDASYIMITEGEMQGSLTNSEVRGCKVTMGGPMSERDLPFSEFSYTEQGCVLRALRPDQRDGQ